MPTWYSINASSAPDLRRPPSTWSATDTGRHADDGLERREQRARSAPPPFDLAGHGARLPAAIDGATLLYPYHTERASWFYVHAAEPHWL